MENNTTQMIDKNLNIAVLAGGMSDERSVSLRSGTKALKALLDLGYKNSVMIDVNKDIASVLKEKNIDVAFNTLHGKYGEDGCIQGVLEILGIPYTGCGVMSSALCMDKEMTKKVLRSSNIPVINSVCSTNKEELIINIKDNLKFPVILKPITQGSSIGMNVANNLDELNRFIDEARKYSSKVMAEEYLNGISVTVGVLETNNNVFATEILEFRTKTDWYDYEAKYTPGLTQFVCPASLSASMASKVKEYALNAFEVCGCRGVSRVDFLVTEDMPYVLEVNTNPGLTDLSDLPHQANVSGIDYNNLIQLILNTGGISK